MFSIRRNVFETNSSSTHSVTISYSDLLPPQLEVVEDWDICDGEPTILVTLDEFCSWCDHDSQNSKLAYLIQQIAYITENEYAMCWYGTSEEQEEDKNNLYNSEEYKELESEICDYVGCKHIRIKDGCSGYIDHDSVCMSISDLKYDDLGCEYTRFVFGAGCYVHFEFNG